MAIGYRIMISPDNFDDITANGVKDYDAYFGTPTYDDHVLFELLVVGILQVGLGWRVAASQLPVLRQHMAGLRVDAVAALDEPDFERLMLTPKVMHNGRKLRAIIQDARAIQQLQAEYGSFSNYLWRLSMRHQSLCRRPMMNYRRAHPWAPALRRIYTGMV